MRGPLAAAAVAAATLAGVAAPLALATTVAITFPEDEESAPYTPALPEIAPGDSVTFTGGFTNHPLRWIDHDFATQDSGSERTYAFPRPGSYRFVCDFHSDMTGRVLVLGNQVAVPDFTVSPEAPVAGATVTFDGGAVRDPNPGGSIARYEWDLDANGTFEQSGADAVVTRTFAAAGTYSARLRVVDDGHDASTTTSREVVVKAPAAPTGGGGGAAEGGGGGGAAGGATGPGTGSGSGSAPGSGTGAGSAPEPGADRRAPTASLTAASAGRAIVLRGGVAAIGLRLDEAGAVSASLRKGASRTVLGRGAARLKAGTATLRVRLTKAGLRAIKRGRRTKLALLITARDAAGNTRTVRRALTLRR